MNLLLKLLLSVFLSFCAISILAIGMLSMKSLGIGLDGSGRFWFILIVTVASAMSLMKNALEVIEKK